VGYTEPSEEELRQIYADTKTIATVGASTDESKPAHYIPEYLSRVGFQVVPVNPRAEQIWGVKAYPKLEEVPVEVDAVQVFRPSEESPDIARSAVAIGAKVLWMQEGVRSDEAYAIASEAGLKVVMDRCMGTTHRYLFG
jgi:predicted CoA-binding protein